MVDEEMNVYYILNVCGARARTKYALLTSCFPPLFAPAILGLSFASVEFCTLRCLPNQIGPFKEQTKMEFNHFAESVQATTRQKYRSGWTKNPTLSVAMGPTIWYAVRPAVPLLNICRAL